MIRNYDLFTTVELLKIRDETLRSTAYWINSTDGSYEAALDAKGYYSLTEELNKRKTNETNNSCKPT